ncbi:DNA repair protein rhp7 [Trichoderma asperellum]|uniref:DNA repair protein rhp7 n=1 Tax=Trichoderma asperellum TaxID=101201 RepID=A0A6V8QYW0_TRIAP|nr:DNA repair protein rhp7 [Trichoderma asperellum]
MADQYDCPGPVDANMTKVRMGGQVSHNISAAQIRAEADRRREQAGETGETEETAEAGEAEATEENEVAETVEVSVTVEASSSGRGARSRNAAAEKKAKALDKIKASKAFKKRKKGAEDDEYDDEIAQAIFEERSAPLPGQMENCEICGKRFTVTPYSVAGPDGGLLCAPCGREIAKEREGQPKKKARKQTGGVGSRRTIQSRMLDGDVGTKSLATLCVQTLAKNVELAESLGDLPEHLIDKIARIFSKRRLLKPDTLPLFTQPTTEVLHIYDGAKLGHQEFISIFQVASNLKKFKVRCAVQFKDEVMDYLLSRDILLESFYLHGANLLSEDKWHEFLAAKGKSLKELQVYFTDRHFGDETLGLLKEYCPDLTRLKVCHNQKVTDQDSSAEALRTCITQIGKDLRTLSFKIVPDADDSVLEAIHNTCRSLSKLRITESESMTDKGFAKLFTDWENPPLDFLDLQKCRQLDAAHPRENPDGIGLCSEGFKALMNHSGHTLKNLNVHACRHISREAFEEVFDGKKQYPELRKLEISFCEEVTDFILGCIFRACPNIKEVNVFGCMKVKEGMITEGTD